MLLTLKKDTVSARLDVMRKMGENAKQYEREQMEQAERRRKLQIAEHWLMQFPAFKQSLPLKVGIHRDINQLYKSADLECGWNHIQSVIHWIVNPESYQRELSKGKRYNLDGTINSVE